MKLAKQHIIYGESGGKFLTAMDTLGPGAFYKFKQRINQQARDEEDQGTDGKSPQ